MFVYTLMQGIVVKAMASPGFEGGGAKTFAREARAQNLSHAPKTLITPLIKRVLEGSWLTKKAVLGQIATRNCCFGSEF